MSYIGNQVTSVPHIIDTFTGTGTGTSFGPLTRAPAGTAAIAVFITGSYQIPGVDYTLNGDYINFTSAPFNLATIVVHHLGNGSTTQVPSDGSVTGTKLAVNSVRGNNIVVGTITGNLIAANSISGNQIGLYAVSGNQIGTGAISANNFAGGGITSNVLASNLQVSISRVAETINTVSSGITGTYNIHIANSTVYYFTANTTGNVTFNLRANTQNTLDSIVSTGQTASVTIFLKQGSIRYRANVQVDGVLQTAYWLGNSQPSYLTSQSESFDVYNFSVLKTAANTYAVFAANAQFAIALGQGINGVGQ